MLSSSPGRNRILVVRLGAMGDIIHTLPAAASLKHSYPGSHLTWVVESRWRPLLEDNPFIDRIVELRRGSFSGLLETVRELRSARYDVAVDFQGLLKSATAATFAWLDRIFGYHQSQVRERVAALFYSNKTVARAAHVVDRHLELAAAAGAIHPLRSFPLPGGCPEGDLPANDFVLASPGGAPSSGRLLTTACSPFASATNSACPWCSMALPEAVSTMTPRCPA